MSLRFPYRHPVLKKLIIALLCVAMVTPPTEFGTSVAQATTQVDTNGEDDETTVEDCPPVGPAQSTIDAPPVAVTSDPVHLRRGAVIESEVDLRLPGPASSWSHSRSYDSGSPGAAGGRNLYWMGGDTGPFLVAEQGGGGGGGVQMIVSATNKRVFKTSGLTPPADYPATILKSGSGASERYTITETETGVILIFYGLNPSISAGNRGRLLERTNRSLAAASPPIPGVAYSYNSDGKIAWVLTGHPQTRRIDYEYTTAGGETQLSAVKVRSGGAGSSIVAKAEYAYYDSVVSPSTDLGANGDLVQVKVSRLASDGTTWIERVTQYRYYRSGDSDGRAHQLKGVYAPDAVQRAIDGEAGVSDAADMLTEADSVVGKYASRAFTYYTADLTTNGNVTTPWGSQNLQSRYDGSEFDEYNEAKSYGAVKSETLGGCASCGGSAPGAKRTYFYLDQNGGTSSDRNTVVRIVIEDTDDGASPRVARYRRIWGLNSKSVALREAFIEHPDGTPLKAWCQSTKLNSDGRITEQRMPSAHTIVDTDTELAQFLNPTGAGGDNDIDTVNDSVGVVYYYEYDTAFGDGKHRTGTRVRQGAGEFERYYVAATDWGKQAAADQPYHLPLASYVYPEQTDSRSDGSRIKTEAYSYEFWDAGDTAIKKVTTTLPAISSTTQNGSGVATTREQLFDTYGRLRWTKDGEGYVNYYSHHPLTGGLAYMAEDVSNSYTPAGDDGSKWVAVTDGDADVIQPTRGASDASLGLVSKTEYDNLGRTTKSIDAGGGEHVTRYFSDGVAHFPYVPSTTATLPVQVAKTDAGGQTTESLSISPSAFATTATSIPTTASNYVTRTTYSYDSVNGLPLYVDRYHDVEGSAISTAYDRTAFYYDALGRRAASAQSVEGTSVSSVTAQLTYYEHDARDRVTGSKRWRATAYDLASSYSSIATTAASKAVFSTTTYDGGGVGDGRVTSSKRYFGTGSTDFIDSIPKYTFRGHVRGVEQRNNTTPFGPYRVQDIDWMGRAVVAATYTLAPTWPTDYGAYVTTTSSNRNDMTKTYYDDLGRVYRTERFPGTQSTNHLRTDNYYDRNGQLVASGDPHGVTTEMAYDGVGRQYQQRVVKELSSSTPYSSGAFVYCDPAPLPGLVAGWTGAGNDGVIEMSHTVYDASGNAVEEHQFEKNHTDTDGITFSGTADYVRSTTHHWYDGADRLTATAYYGSGNTSSADAWQFNTAPTRGSALAFTDAVVYDGKALLTTYGYNAASGRAERTTMGVKKNGTNTDTTTTKTFYDDLGRRVFVAENWVDFAPPSTGIGGGTNNDQDRVTGWEYFGLGQVHKLTAYNNSGSTANQVTEYRYADPHDASRVTMTIYPDGDATSDNVQVAYQLDGSVNTRTDQRGVVMTYTYDAQRRVIREGATTLPSGVDGSVKAIGRSYDTLGRVETITSYPNSDGSGTPVNQINYSYDSTHGRLTKSEQSHAGAVTTGTPAVQYAYDSTAVSGLYTNALRRIVTVYPNYRVVWEEYGATGGLDNRLGRVAELRDGGPSGTLLAEYAYNGVGRPVTRRLPQPKVVQQDDWNEDREYETLDRFGRRLRMWHHGDGYAGNYDRYDDFLYEYDYAGNRTKRDLFIDTGMMTSNLTGVAYTSDDFDQEYAYDGLQRLEGSEQKTDAGANNREEQWGLDQLGNWSGFKVDSNGDGVFTSAGDLDQTRAHNQANEVGAISEASGQAAWSTVSHDAAGNMTVFPSPVRPEDGASCVYDAWNRLIIYDDVTWAVVARYDGLHRRVSRQVVNTVHYYLNEQWQEIEERATESGPATKQFVWGATYIDELVLRDRDADANGTSLEERLYALYDALYSVTCVVNASGVVQERFAYSPYGESTVLDDDFTVKSGGSSIDWQHRFTGRRRDPETGLQLNRYRYYHAGLGRWLTRDPIGYAAGTNLKEYVDSSPAGFPDPTGLLVVLAPAAPFVATACETVVAHIIVGGAVYQVCEPVLYPEYDYPPPTHSPTGRPFEWQPPPRWPEPLPWAGPIGPNGQPEIPTLGPKGEIIWPLPDSAPYPAPGPEKCPEELVDPCYCTCFDSDGSPYSNRTKETKTEKGCRASCQAKGYTYTCKG